MQPLIAPGKHVQSRVPEVLEVNIAFTAFAVFIVLLRIWTRLKFVKVLKSDDYIIVGAAAVSVFYGIDVCLQTKYGFGYHIYDLINPSVFIGSLKLFYGGEIAYYVIVGVTKISLLIFFLRMFVTTSFKKLRILSCALLVFTSLLTSATVFAIVFQCTPVALAWDKTLEGTCVDVTTVFYSHAGINISLDFIIYITPMPMLWSVQRPIRERMALIVVFAIGGFVCVTGILRLWSLQHAATSEDPSWDNEPSGIWSCIEANVGIVCACLPSLKPLFSHIFSNIPRSSNVSKASNSRNFAMLSDSQTGLHRSSRVDIELGDHKASYNRNQVVVRTDELRVERGM